MGRPSGCKTQRGACTYLRAAGSADETDLPRLDDVVGELAEQARQHVAVVAGLLGVEEAGVVDETAAELVELAQVAEVVAADADPLHEDRQLGHAGEQVRRRLAVRRLTVGDDDREGRVGRRGLDRQRAAGALAEAEEATTAAPAVGDVGRPEAGRLDDPLQRRDVAGAAPLGALALDEALAVAQRDVAEVLDPAVEERHRHLAVVVEDEAGGEDHVGDALHLAAPVERLGRPAVVEAADDGGLVVGGVEPLLEDDRLGRLDERDQVGCVLLDLVQGHGCHCKLISRGGRC